MTYVSGGDRNEVRLIIYDVIGSRPGFGIFGRLFWATDEDRLYYDTGAAWIQLTAEITDTRTETLVVAASNSLDPTLAPTAYRCSGVDDDVEINAALVAAAAVNGSVMLLEGAYNTILTLSVAVNVVLKAVGWGAVINFDASGNAITIAGDNVKLRDFKVVIVAGAGGAGTRPNCIYATARTNVEITKLWLVGDLTVGDDGSFDRQDAIFFDIDMTYSKIAFCTVEDHQRVGIKFTGTSGNEILHTEIAGNIIVNNVYDGIRCDYTNYSIVTENNILDTAQDGLTLVNCSNNTVTGNTSVGNTGLGISVFSTSTYNTIVGNMCQGNIAGIRLATSSNNCTVTGNTCQGNGYAGIEIDSSNNCTVTGNMCQGNEYGVRIGGVYDSTFTGNSCSGNTRDGIYLFTSNNCTVTGNACHQNVRRGIYVSESSGNTIVGNTCNENDSGDTNTYDGIGIGNDSDYNLVHSNTCNDNDRWGISIGIIADSCVGNWVKDNHLRGNTSGPFFDAGTDTKLAVKVFQFTTPFGGDAAWVTTSPTGILVDAAGEGALALGEAPLEIQMVVRFRVKGVCKGATGAGKGMLLEININAGKPKGHEAYNAETIAVAGVISTEDNVALNDAIEWIIDATDDEDVDDIEFGETIEMFAIFEDAGADSDIATNALIRTISMEYV